LQLLGEALKAVAGKGMKDTLARLSRSPGMGVLSGMVVTGISNSLTLVSVLLVGFVASDLMPFERCIPVLMGAGIGSTFIGLLVVFKITKYGLGLVALGFFYTFVKKKPSGPAEDLRVVEWETRNNIAIIVMGLGLIFHGSELMGGAFGFLKTSKDFLDFLATLSSPGLGLSVGLALTGLVQSSGASLGIFLNLAQQGLLQSKAGIAMTLGANVGTCLTALLAAIGQGEGPMQVAIALTLARAIGAAMCCIWMSPLQWLSAVMCGVDSTATIMSPSDTGCVIASSHTIFNVVLCAAVVPFSDQYAKVVRRLIPSKDKGEDPIKEDEHLLDIEASLPSPDGIKRSDSFRGEHGGSRRTVDGSVDV